MIMIRIPSRLNVEAGYRHVDTAAEYGVQDQVGRGIKAAIEREHLFITSELRRHIKNCSCTYLRDGASRPPKTGDFSDFDMERVWKEMEKLVKDNLVKRHQQFYCEKTRQATQFCADKAFCVPDGKHPGWRNDKMFDACKKHGIHATAHSPLGSQGGRDLLHDPVVEKIARKLKKSRGQVLLRWAIQRGTSTIPKSNNPDRIMENLHVFWWQIPDQDFRTLSSIPDQKRVLDGGSLFVTETNGPYKSIADVLDH